MKHILSLFIMLNSVSIFLQFLQDTTMLLIDSTGKHGTTVIETELDLTGILSPVELGL